MKTIIESIKYNNGTFPRSEVQQIIERKDEAIPLLLDIVKEVKDSPEKYIDDQGRIDLHFAIYLLSQFRVKELFPLLLDIMSLPDEMLDKILGDTITEGSGRMLASIFNGDVQAIQEMIENTELDEFARGQGLHAMVILALHERIERTDVVSYFQTLLGEKLTDNHFTFNAHIVSGCVDLHATEAYELIKQAYEKGAVDSFMINMNDVDRHFAIDKDLAMEERRNNRHHELIGDTIGEMEWWACFEKDRKKRSEFLSKRQSKIVNVLKPSNPAVIVEKIGRNDPCPCGSGKKYKKCCGK
jgi:hypothetical protein